MHEFKMRFCEMVRGASAYEVAARNGFEGTEAEWVASLEEGAKTAEANAKKSETNAAEFEEKARQYAENSEHSASSAAGSAAAATQSENNAANHAAVAAQEKAETVEASNTAKASAQDAAKSAAAAKASEARIEQSVQNVLAASNRAVAAEQSAEQYKTNAANSAKKAADSEVAAESHAQRAAQSAESAAKSAEEAKNNAGSGGMGGADWNAAEGEAGHILNRPFYTDGATVHQLDPQYIPDMYYTGGVGRIPILQETTAEFAPGPILYGPPEYILPNVLNLVEGKTYYVTWDGEEYECVCKKAVGTINGVSMEALLIGNRVMVGEEQTGEPFIMGTIISPMNISLAATFSEDEYTFKIEEKAETIRKLNNKYLNLAWLPCMVKTGATLVFEETVHLSSSGAALYEEIPFTITPGKTYTVTWNGVEYECVAKHVEWNNGLQESSIPFDCIGNLYVIDSEYPNSGEPFVLHTVENTLFYIDNETIHDADVAVKVVENELNPNKMPEEWLPESVDGVIIRSSTEGSTKKFRLTIDDSGAISATEV